MNVVILCGGLGTRLSEETHLKPKPMVEIGGRPILWHIMSHYASYGFKDFTLALGYKAEVIKNYFLNYHMLKSDFVVDLKNGNIEVTKDAAIDWRISLVDTGLHTMTGGRVIRLKDKLINNGTFMLTYGDGLANINVHKLLDFHRNHGKMATVTAVRPAARFGQVVVEDGLVTSFKEKPQSDQGWINGGFFVFEPEVLDYFSNGDPTVLEKEPLERLAEDRQLMAYRHEDFWQCMDTLRDKQYLDTLWSSGDAPWNWNSLI